MPALWPVGACVPCISAEALDPWFLPSAKWCPTLRMREARSMRYELYYWPTIQGRGEFVRLALEEAGADYVDVARRSERSGMGLPAMLKFLTGAECEQT